MYSGKSRSNMTFPSSNGASKSLWSVKQMCLNPSEIALLTAFTGFSSESEENIVCICESDNSIIISSIKY